MKNRRTFHILTIFLFGFISYIRSEENEITKAMRLHEVIPDVIDEGPKDILKITFDNGAMVNKGDELTPTQVQNQPQFEWKVEVGTYYTLLMTEADAPSRCDLSLREWQHWLVVNIPENDITKGDVLSGYQGSGPGKGSGLHRYIYLLFKQPQKLEFDEKFSAANSIEGRSNFSTRKFAEKYGLGVPIAGNFYNCQYDEYSDVLLAKLGLKL